MSRDTWIWLGMTAGVLAAGLIAYRGLTAPDGPPAPTRERVIREGRAAVLAKRSRKVAADDEHPLVTQLGLEVVLPTAPLPRNDLPPARLEADARQVRAAGVVAVLIDRRAAAVAAALREEIDRQGGGVAVVMLEPTDDLPPAEALAALRENVRRIVAALP